MNFHIRSVNCGFQPRELQGTALRYCKIIKVKATTQTKFAIYEKQSFSIYGCLATNSRKRSLQFTWHASAILCAVIPVDFYVIVGQIATPSGGVFFAVAKVD